MIKKHLITCSVIPVVAVIFKLTICNTTVAKPPTKSAFASKFIFLNNDAVANYSFADEAMPANNVYVTHKMKVTLIHHNFKNVQSHILHIKARRLFPVIEPILKKYGIPNDFKYLPLVESGLSEGTSSKGAAGVWQFMPGTARIYGLKVRNGQDDRLNVRKSTIAACRYIRDLHREFRSWTLAAAAYNNGDIKLAKAMRMSEQKERNYYSMHLNRETGSYVYNIVAMKEIIDKPAKYGYGGFYSYVPPAQLFQYN